MRFSDIKIKHIYNVIFDPVKRCEFNGKHLALVLKRNNDNQTYIVMPLTSIPNGDGVNKFNLGIINSLPLYFRKNNTYAVFNQIRTVNANRFISLKEGFGKNKKIIESKINDKDFINLLHLGIDDILFNLDQENKIKLLKKAYEKECVIKAKDLAYNILKLKKKNTNNEDKIISIKNNIADTLEHIPYFLYEEYINDDIENIFNEILKK